MDEKTARREIGSAGNVPKPGARCVAVQQNQQTRSDGVTTGRASPGKDNVDALRTQ
jgi:hypothetical protein